MTASQDLARRPGRNVAIIDDEPSIHIVCSKALASAGYTTESFRDSNDALLRIAAEPERFGLVFTDLHMPGLSGLDVADHLLKIRPAIPIILMSGYMAEHQVVAATLRGIRKVLVKPFSRSTLLTAAAEAGGV